MILQAKSQSPLRLLPRSFERNAHLTTKVLCPDNHSFDTLKVVSADTTTTIGEKEGGVHDGSRRILFSNW
jgi:hypothetical protein